jgi:signal transduction histidine kinase
MIRRLRKKFLLAAVAAVFLVLLVLIGAINAINYQSLVREADATLEILVQNKGAFPRQMLRPLGEPGEMRDAPPDGGRDDAPEMHRGGFGELAYQSRFFAVWFDGDGNLSRSSTENIVSLTEENAAEMAQAVLAKGREKGFADGFRYRRALCDGETMLVFLLCDRELGTFRMFLYASVGISFVGILAVFLLLLLFSGRIVRPIAESYEKQKRFITDAGHELKTPITIIRADADVLESEMAGESEWIEDIRQQTRRLSELTADMIFLSRMEEENAALQSQDLSLSELVEETARSFQALARSRNKRFRASVAPELRMTGDEKALARLVSVLMDNAMKYSPEGGSVELTLEKTGRNGKLTVKNSSQPMEKGNADHLLERFARGDSSRNSESGGFGLGLSIARAVTEAHRGRIHAQSEDGESLTVTVELPLV